MTQPLAMTWLDHVDDDLDLIACCYRIAIRLKRYMRNETAETFVTMETIAHDLGVHIRTVRRGISALIGAGHLEKADVSTPKGGTRPGFRGLVSNGQICPPPTPPNKVGTTQEKRVREMNTTSADMTAALQTPLSTPKPPAKGADWWPEPAARVVVPLEDRGDFDGLRLALQPISTDRTFIRWMWSYFTRKQLLAAYKAAKDSGRKKSKWRFPFLDHFTDVATEAAAPKPRSAYTLDEQREKWPEPEPELMPVDPEFAAMVSLHGAKEAIRMALAAAAEVERLKDPRVQEEMAKVQALRDAGDEAGAEFWERMYRGEEVGGRKGGSAYE